MVDLAAFGTVGREPVPGDSPVGIHARYEPEFEQISVEVGKLTSVTQEKVDWRVVADLGTALLRDKSKDLLIACYTAFALYRREGLPGLAAGCQVCRDMVDTFWDGLFPEKRRMRARTAALDWLAERVEAAVPESGDGEETDRPHLEAAIESLEALRDTPGFGSDGPTLGPALRALRAKLDSIPRPPEPEPEPEREPEPEPEAKAEPEPDAARAPPEPEPEPAPEPEPEPDTPDRVREALREARVRWVEFARVLRLEPADPAGYRLLRQALWAEPPEITDGTPVAVSVGDPAVLADLHARIERGDEAEVLAATEELLPEHPFWLDLQLVAARAVESMGRRYVPVRDAILAATADLLRRCPGLTSARNADDRAVAADPTRIWVGNELLPGPAAGSRDEVAAAGAEARRMAARDELGGAIRFLTSRIDATAGRRGRFRLRLDLARLCIESGRSELAVPQLEQLEQEVNHFSIEEWEPDLATEVVRLLWECCSGGDPAPALADRSREIYARLCRLDPAAAVSSRGPGD